MACMSEGELRAQLDGGLAADRETEFAGHLAHCPHCRARLVELRERAGWVAERFEASAGGAAPEAAASWRRWQARARAARTPQWPRWAGVGAAAAVLVTLAIWPAARSRAADVLALLRVENVTVAPVTPPLAGEPEVRRQVGQMIEQLISSRLVVTVKPGPPQLAASPATAAALAGFKLRLPAGAAPSRLEVSGAAAFQMTVDRDRTQAILDEAGRPDLQLPANIDGALIAVQIPRGVLADYGQCQMEAKPGNPRPRLLGANCLRLREVPSPTLSVPPGLDLNQLAEIGLQFAGMSAEEAAAFCRAVDWRSTLVIPVPRDNSTYQRLPVDGVSGILLQQTDARRTLPAFALIWVRQGVIYSLNGRGDPAAALNLASQMQ